MRSVVVLVSAIVTLLAVPARTQQIPPEGRRGPGLRLDEDLRLQGRDGADDRRSPGVFDRPAECRQQLRELDPAKLRAGRRTGRCHPVRLREADPRQPGHQVAAPELRGHREDLLGSEVRRRPARSSGSRPTISSGASARTTSTANPPSYSARRSSTTSRCRSSPNRAPTTAMSSRRPWTSRRTRCSGGSRHTSTGTPSPVIRSPSCSPGTTGCRS